MRIISTIALIIGFLIFWLLISIYVPASLCFNCLGASAPHPGSTQEGFVESIKTIGRPHMRYWRVYIERTRRDMRNGYPGFSRLVGI